LKFETGMKSLVLSGLLAAGLLTAAAQEAAPSQSPAADNTQTNQRDRNSNQPTADQQKDNGHDRELARQIRKAIVSDKSLSTYGHNVKVIAQGGQVTLKGPVRSAEEKQAIEAKASQVAGDGNVVSQLEIAPGKP
jgi:hyperosmotically inducible periplasmic protein